MIINDSQEFERLIKNSYQLIEISKHFPGYSNQLIRKVLNDFQDFQWLIKDNDDLHNISIQFPSSLFNKASTAKEAYHLLKLKKSEAEIKKNTSVIKQALRTHTSFFQYLPLELLTSTLAFTRDNEIQTEKEATQWLATQFIR